MDIKPEFLESNGQVISTSQLLFEMDDETPIEPIKVEKEKEELEVPIPDKVIEQKPDLEPSVLVKEEKIEQPNPAPKSSEFKTIINKMVELGHWSKLEEIELQDGTMVPFEDAEIDEDAFKQISKFQEETKAEALLAGKVDVTGTTEFTRKLIEIEKNGGNVQQALEIYQTIQDPLSSLDMSTPEGQSGAIYLHYSQKGLDEKMIETLIKGFVSEGKLEEEGEKSKKFLEDASAKLLDKVKEEAITAKENRKTQIKEYKKGLVDTLTALQITDNVKKKLIEAATKEDEQGRFEIDKVYSAKRKDPKEAAEMIHYLMDKEGYLKKKMEEMSYEKDIKTFRTFKLVKTGGDSTNINRQTSKTGEGEIEPI